jgi:hypothetical protein
MSEGSMKGSGIDSVELTLEVECEECGKTWEEDFSTDDRGNVFSDVKCECGNAWTFEKEQEEVGSQYEPDEIYPED